MKALSLWQPYASAIAMGLKHYETRSWTTKYRGPLVIAAALTFKGVGDLTNGQRSEMAKVMDLIALMDLPAGVALCVCDLVEVFNLHDQPNVTISSNEYLFGNWVTARYAWKLDNVRVFPKPIPIKGKQGLFTCPTDIAIAVEAL